MGITSRLNFIKTKFLTSSIIRKNVLILISGTITGQIINLLVTPLLSRFYTPQQFGNLAVFTSIAAIISLFSTGQYELAITLPKRKEDSLNVVALTSFLVATTSLVVFGVLLLFRKFFVGFIPEDIFSLWIFLMPISIFLTGLGQVFYYWVIYKKGFKEISLNTICKAASTNALQVVNLFISALKGSGLLIGQVFGQLFATSLFAKHILKTERYELKNIHTSDIREQAKRYKKFPTYSLPANLVNVTANQLPVILLGGAFGLSVVGQFSLTQKILGVPGVLISTSILSVFKERASRDYRETNSCRDIYIKTLKALFSLSIIPFFALFMVTPRLIPYIFGPNWVAAGIYAQILTVMYFFRFIASPLSYVLIVAEKQAINLTIQLLLLAITFASIQFGKHVGDPKTSLTFFSLGYSIIYLAMLLISYKFTVGRENVQKN